MLKLTFAVVAIAVAGTAAAAGWRDLRIDASSEAAFSKSIATLTDELSPSRKVAFTHSLQDVWIRGTLRAAEQGEYTRADYFRELDGLRYEEVVKLTDPTGMKAKRYRATYYYARAWGGPPGTATTWRAPDESYRPYEGGSAGRPYRGGTDLTGPAMHGDPRYPVWTSY